MKENADCAGISLLASDAPGLQEVSSTRLTICTKIYWQNQVLLKSCASLEYNAMGPENSACLFSIRFGKIATLETWGLATIAILCVSQFEMMVFCWDCGGAK